MSDEYHFAIVPEAMFKLVYAYLNMEGSAKEQWWIKAKTTRAAA